MIKPRTSPRLRSVLLCLGLALGLVLVPDAARAAPGLHRALHALVEFDDMTGAIVETTTRGDHSTSVTAGTAEVASGEPMVDGEAQYRVGSLTKPVVAATVLLLAERGMVELDAPVDRYLPGQVRGQGAGAAIDGRLISVRQLLQQVSGLPEFSDAVEPTDPPDTPPEMLAVALQRTPTGRPGESFSYANTNYLVLGMIIDATTGQDFRQVVADRVLVPLGLEGSYWPAPGELGIRGPHAHTYVPDPADPHGGLVDVTRRDGHLLGASGGLVSTPADLNRFWQALFSGTLLSPSSMLEMTGDTVPVPDPGWPDGARYGLGVARAHLPCSGTVWMHGGGLEGLTTLSGWARNGHAATVYVTGNLTTSAGAARLEHVLDRAMCHRR